MRIISAMLFIYVSLLIVSPSICGMCASADETEMCSSSCEYTQCSGEQNENESSEKDSPCTPCCLIQNCNCCFIAPTAFEFQPLIVFSVKKIQSKNDIVVSNYSSDCWHPPEMV